MTITQDSSLMIPSYGLSASMAGITRGYTKKMITQKDIKELDEIRIKADNVQLDKIINFFEVEKIRRTRKEEYIIRKMIKKEVKQ